MSNIGSLLPRTIVNLFFHFPLAVLANIYYGFPSRKMRIIGVTGTDGKTTTVSLIHHILSSANIKTAMVSTVLAKIGSEEIDTGFHVTAPDPWLLQKLLKKMVNKGVEIVVLEATSHGLDQFRLLGINFDIGVLTNITHEHLDYHKSFEKYRLAKLKLLKKAKTAILNKDDESYSFLDAKTQRYKDTKTITYGIKNKADFTPLNFPFKCRLLGKYNQYNCLAAIAATKTLGVSEEKIKEAVKSFKGVIGRMEEINEGQSFKAIVDFAHTPNALENCLTTLKKELKGRGKLIAVFGAAGLRDKTKRPVMGKIASRLADFVVITAEDPRTEDVDEIINQIAAGCETKNYYKISDRQKAINFAIQQLASKEDIVVACGKGHEKSMCFGTTEYPWSDQEAVKIALLKVSQVPRVSKVSRVRKETR